MRFLLWTAAIWAAMFLGVLAIDIGYTIATGSQADHAVTERIDFAPGDPGLLGTMGRMSRGLDRLGDTLFGPYVGLFELLMYGLIAPLFIAGPIGWEASRRQWARSGAIVLTGFAGLVIAAWLLWKYPDPSAVYYGLVNALLICCRAVGLSYYSGSLVYFVISPLLFALGYIGVLSWSRILSLNANSGSKPS